MTTIMAKFGATVIGGNSRTGADMSVDQIISDLRRQIVDRKLRVKDFLKEHDRLNTGRVTKVNFKRALQAANLIISENNANRICDAFEAAHADDVIDYARFHDRLDEVFTAKGLSVDPTRKVSNRSNVTGRFDYGTAVQPEYESLIQELLQKVRKFADTKQFFVSDPFRHFDKLNRGSVTTQQFLRVLNIDFLVTVSDELEAAVTQRFGANGMVQYRKFCDEVGYSTKTSPTHSASGGPSGHAANRRAPGISRTLSENLGLLYRTMLDRNVNVKDRCQDYDKLRRGYITVAQFAAVLSAAGLGSAFKSADLDAIAGNFLEPSNGMVRYTIFLDTVERKRKEAPAAAAVSATSSSSPANQTVLLKTILRKINGASSTSRHTMIDTFKDFDVHRNLHVTAAQFDRVLHRNGVLSRISKKELEYLRAQFSNTLRGDMINYQTFINELNKLNKTSPAGAAVATQIRARTPPSRVDVQYLIASIKDRVKKLRIRMADFFSDYDPLRSGFVSANLFTTALETARLQLTGPQQDGLAKYYANAEGGCDAQNQPFVQYSRFVQDLNSVFSKDNLEADPTADVAAFTRTSAALGNAENDEVLDPQNRLSPADEGKLKEVLTRVDTYVKRVQQDILTPFTDFDRNRRGIVTAEQFKRAVKKCLDFLTEDDVAIIMKAFQAPDATGSMGSLDSGANRARYMSYKWFVSAVDNIDGVLSNLPSPGDLRMESIPLKTGGVTSTHSTRPNRLSPLDNFNPSVSAEAALQKLRQLQLTQRKKVRPFFEQYDPLRKKHITMAKFQCALDNAGFQLSRSEQNALEQKYKHYDSRKTDLILYEPLLSDLQSVAAPPTTQPGSATHLEFAVRSTVAKLAHIVQQRRILCKNDFVARDRQNEGTITPSQFRGVIVALGLKEHISDAALESLDKAFRSDKDPKRVDYKLFLSLVEPTK